MLFFNQGKILGEINSLFPVSSAIAPGFFLFFYGILSGISSGLFFRNAIRKSLIDASRNFYLNLNQDFLGDSSQDPFRDSWHFLHPGIPPWISSGISPELSTGFLPKFCFRLLSYFFPEFLQRFSRIYSLISPRILLDSRIYLQNITKTS